MSILLTIFGIGSVGVLLYLITTRYTYNGGFYRRNCKNIPTKLHGKTVIITGGNAGIGKETAIDLARRGAKVIIGCRNPKKAETAIDEIKQRSASNHVVFRHLELSDQDSIREFAEIILKEEPRIDYLINNAGTGKTAKGLRTKEGFNMVFAVNHFGPFLLTMLLIDRLKESSPSRILNVSSVAHIFVKPGEMTFALKDDEGRVYPGLREYPRSKLANILFTKELARRLEDTGVTAYAIHPGAIITNIFKPISGASRGSTFAYWIIMLVMYLVGSNEESGAQTTIYCALEESIAKSSGGYYDNCRLAKESAVARDAGLAKKLWEISSHATGL